MKRDKVPPDHNSATLPANLRQIIDAIPGFILLFALFFAAAMFAMAASSDEKAEQKNMLLLGHRRPQWPRRWRRRVGDSEAFRRPPHPLYCA